MNPDKILGDERRTLILEWLKEADEPITGSDLAKRTHVSRQVIVQDISLLKAKNEPIIATAQGYLYIRQNGNALATRVVACKHQSNQMEEELDLIVSHGVTVKDVSVEHPIYGELTANLLLRTKRDVTQFVSRMNESNATLLSALTDGTHLHTLEGVNQEQLERVVKALEDAGFLLS